MATRTLSIKHSGRTQWREVECKAGGEKGEGGSQPIVTSSALKSQGKKWLFTAHSPWRLRSVGVLLRLNSQQTYSIHMYSQNIIYISMYTFLSERPRVASCVPHRPVRPPGCHSLPTVASLIFKRGPSVDL